MHRVIAVSCLSLLLGSAAAAGGLERDVKAGWLGAWVVVRAESYSDCGSYYTNNRINGSLVKSRGAHAFPAGELAKVQKLNVKKQRLDLHLELAEPRLLSYREGPFTLYREASCRIELEVVLDRNEVKGRDLGAIDRRLTSIVERFSSADAARETDTYNEREREDYPDDYEITLARLAVWRAEQTNAGVQAKLDKALERTTRLADRIDPDPEYLVGFAKGVEQARAAELSGCPAMLAVDLGDGKRSYRTEEQTAESRGTREGKQLVQGLELLRRLPGCFVPVPDPPPFDVAGADTGDAAEIRD